MKIAIAFGPVQADAIIGYEMAKSAKTTPLKLAIGCLQQLAPGFPPVFAAAERSTKPPGESTITDDGGVELF